MLQPSRTFLLGTWPHPPELQRMLLRTRWRQEPVREEVGVTEPEVSKAAVDVLLSTIAFQRQPSSLYNKQVHHQNVVASHQQQLGSLKIGLSHAALEHYKCFRRPVAPNREALDILD